MLQRVFRAAVLVAALATGASERPATSAPLAVKAWTRQAKNIED